MPETITIRKDFFDEMIKKKDEFDAIVESIELMSNPQVRESLNKSREDFAKGNVHRLRDVL